MPRKPYRYVGELLKPITTKELNAILGTTEPSNAAVSAAHLTVAARKMLKLASELGKAREPGMTPSAAAEVWFYVAFTLAMRHVPGFRISSAGPRGRHRIDHLRPDKYATNMKFMIEMDQLIAKRNTVASAAGILSRKAPYKGQSPTTLRKLYAALNKIEGRGLLPPFGTFMREYSQRTNQNGLVGNRHQKAGQK